MNLGENLKNLRKEKNLSQEQLAKMLNVSRQAVSKWESGKTYPDIDNLILLRDIFNVTLDDLIVNESKIKDEEIIEINDLPNNNYMEFDENEEDELSVNLMLGGLMIGMAIGFITDDFMWSTAGSFIGMGIGYILECIRKKDIRNEI